MNEFKQIIQRAKAQKAAEIKAAKAKAAEIKTAKVNKQQEVAAMRREAQIKVWMETPKGPPKTKTPEWVKTVKALQSLQSPSIMLRQDLVSIAGEAFTVSTEIKRLEESLREDIVSFQEWKSFMAVKEGGAALEHLGALHASLEEAREELKDLEVEKASMRLEAAKAAKAVKDEAAALRRKLPYSMRSMKLSSLLKAAEELRSGKMEQRPCVVTHRAFAGLSKLVK